MTAEAERMRSALTLSRISARRELAEMGQSSPVTRSEIDATEHGRRVQYAYQQERARREARQRIADDERTSEEDRASSRARFGPRSSSDRWTAARYSRIGPKPVTCRDSRWRHATVCCYRHGLAANAQQDGRRPERSTTTPSTRWTIDSSLRWSAEPRAMSNREKRRSRL